MKKIKIIVVIALISQILFPVMPNNRLTGIEVFADILDTVETNELIDSSELSDEELISLISKTEAKNPELVAVREEIAEVFSNVETIDIQEFNDEQLEVFENLVDVIVEDSEFPTKEDAQDVEEVLVDFFDSESEVYQNVEATSSEMIDRIDDNHSSIFDPITGEEVLAASHGVISVWVLGVSTNLVINFVIGGLGGSLMGAIRKYGVNWVRNTFKSRVKARFTRVGLTIVAGYYGVVWEFVMAAWDPGMSFAKWVDSRDKKRNNGWIELW